jgi:Spore coat polysaccharide biosynthesis protein F, CMP-KDO synthetase homolog
LVNRISKSKLLDDICIVTSDLPSDDKLEQFANENQINCYRGSLDNIMERILGAANHFKVDSIVEILGDNPLVHSDLIDDVIKLFYQRESDYSANLTKEYPQFKEKGHGFPVGIRVQIYKTKVAEHYTSFPEFIGTDKHPTSFIFENTDKYNVSFIEPTEEWNYLNQPDLHFAVNVKKNFQLVETIFNELYEKNPNFDFNEVLNLVYKNKELYKLMG